MWIEVSSSDYAIVGSPFNAKPAKRDGVEIVECPVTFPQTMMWVASARGFLDVPQTTAWNGTAWVEDVAKVEAALLAQVKAEAEQRKMLILTTGGAKKTEYADKYREVVAWDTLAGTAAQILIAFSALPSATRSLRFAYALADAAAFGDTPADAIARFKVGIGKSASIATIAAIEAKSCSRIKAASTIAAKRAAAAITWPA